MVGTRNLLVTLTAATAIALLPIANASAHGFGRVHAFGVGRGFIGAVAGLVTLPLAIASTIVSAGVQAAPPPGYTPPPPAYYPAPYGYAPYPYAYAPPGPAYAAPRGYYVPRSWPPGYVRGVRGGAYPRR